MKRNLVIAAASVALLCGCSNSDDIKVNGVDSKDLVPINLGLTYQQAEVSRGTGTVGSLDGSVVWQNEEVRLIMTTIGHLGEANGYANWGYAVHQNNSLGAVFPDAEARPVYDNDLKKWYLNYNLNGTTTKYYPTYGQFDFFAYHIDGCATAAGKFNYEDGRAPLALPKGDNAKVSTGNYIYVPFTMDGSQDIMAGKALDADEAKGRVGFAAATARDQSYGPDGKVPNIQMRHLLTRFTFSVDPSSSANGAVINSVALRSATNGELTVAYDHVGEADALSLINWKDDNYVADATGAKLPPLVYLKNEGVADPAQPSVKPEMTDFAKYTLTYDSDPAKNVKALDGCIFVQPNQKTYSMVLNVTFPTVPTPVTLDIPYTLKLDEAASKPFLVGTSYNVKVKFYGMEEIQVDVTLDQWKDGETIEANADAY